MHISFDEDESNLLAISNGEVLEPEEYQRFTNDWSLAGALLAKVTPRGERVWELPLESRIALTSLIEVWLMSGSKALIDKARLAVKQMNCWPIEGFEVAVLLRSMGEMLEQQDGKSKPADLLDGLGTILETIGPYLTKEQVDMAKARAHPNWRLVVEPCPQLVPTNIAKGPMLCLALQGETSDFPLFLDWFGASLFEAVQPASLGLDLSPSLRSAAVSTAAGNDLFKAAQAHYIMHGPAGSAATTKKERERFNALTAPLKQAREYRDQHRKVLGLKLFHARMSRTGDIPAAQAAASSVSANEDQLTHMSRAWRQALLPCHPEQLVYEYVRSVVLRCEAKEG